MLDLHFMFLFFFGYLYKHTNRSTWNLLSIKKQHCINTLDLSQYCWYSHDHCIFKLLHRYSWWSHPTLSLIPGNREGKIFVWELQSSPPVLIAKFVGFAFFGWSLCLKKLQFLCYMNEVFLLFHLFQAVSCSIKVSN